MAIRRDGAGHRLRPQSPPKNCLLAKKQGGGGGKRGRSSQGSGEPPRSGGGQRPRAGGGQIIGLRAWFWGWAVVGDAGAGVLFYDLWGQLRAAYGWCGAVSGRGNLTFVTPHTTSRDGEFLCYQRLLLLSVSTGVWAVRAVFAQGPLEKARRPDLTGDLAPKGTAGTAFGQRLDPSRLGRGLLVADKKLLFFPTPFF